MLIALQSRCIDFVVVYVCICALFLLANEQIEPHFMDSVSVWLNAYVRSRNGNVKIGDH